MRSLIFICFSLVGLTFSQTIELKKTESTYGLFFKSDAYANNMDQAMLAYYSKEKYPHGFYIGNLALKNSKQLQVDFGQLTIKITKNDAQTNVQKFQIVCNAVDLTQYNQGIALYCLNENKYDLITISPADSDTIKIDDADKIKISDSLPTSNNNGDSISCFKGKYLLLALALLFI